MDIAFYKLQCGTEDYILINTLRHPGLPTEYFRPLAISLCKRRSGIGAEGVVFVRSLQREIKLELVLAGGTNAFRGNALLTAARYLFDYGIAEPDSFSITFSGTPRQVDVIDSDNFRICLGEPADAAKGGPLAPVPAGEFTTSIVVNGKEMAVSPVRLFDDFLVHITDDFRNSRLIGLNDSIIRQDAGPGERHPVFLFILSREECIVKFWNRGGSSFDFAAACAAAGVAGVLNGLLDREMVIRSRKQDFYFQWLESDNQVYLTASPGYVFSGNYEFSLSDASS